MPMISELDMVVLTRDLSEHGLQKGDVGTIVHVYNVGAAYEVEFVTAISGVAVVTCV
jgi:hypothetical protein